MRKEILYMLLIGTLSLSFAACQKNNPESTTKEREITERKITLNVRNPKVEISKQFEQMVQAYERENPHIDIQIETVGGATDDLSDLKAQIAAGTGPDIFTNTGYENAKLWRKYLEDLSDQPWVKNAYKDTLSPVTFNEEVYGMPINLEGYGFIYNKDLFKQAGISTIPKTLTELREASKQLQKAGITPFANGYYEEWILGVLLSNIAFAQQEDPNTFIKNLNSGTEKITNNQQFKDIIDLLDLTIEYGNDNPLTTDYNMEMNLFATGASAMMLQGNWVQPMIDQISPDMNIGFLPIPINDERKNDALVVSVSNYWVVNKQSTPEKKKEAKKFLNWMVSSQQGQTFLTEKFKFIPAFKNIESNHSGPLANDTLAYYKEGKTMSSNWFHFPVGVKEEFGSSIQLYVGKQLDRDQLLQEFQKSWNSAASQ
ncbi:MULTISPECIES: ABC transporter substrate-binding protein [Metabacillus]|uniref:ABC transporter substrate-binding protein n=2 Tax=Metabacillus TaxID=2675233 RepID=A0A179T1N9_9BACI|nr:MULTISPECIES: ABC transporter substrate-binding protein [Metabacillus]OAS87825.1 ABC transporter substrate-binding protein [Metabacillus litoralis]QNF27324.1 carbohydrate ABC transporter substrate-binding protein [Metabacillus sp. KUDC1714]